MIPARRRLALPLIGALLLAACSAGPAAPEPGTTPSATPGAGPTGPGQAQPLDGERLGYPCDLADTPPKLLERNAELLAAAGERLAAGTMADALAFLTAEPDVVEAFGSDLAVTFSIEGAPPAWLVDHSDLGPGETSPSEGPAFAMADVVPMPGVVAMPEIQLASVVGDDTTGDGKIDNRDDKRALVLAHTCGSSPPTTSPITWPNGSRP